MSPAGPRVGLLFGGRSVEHEVSLVSARGVFRAMAETSLRCVPLAVTRDGAWLAPGRSREILDGKDRVVDAPAEPFERIVAEPGGGLFVRGNRGDLGPLGPLGIDVLLPLVHGWGGEDGRLQGLLDLVGVPFVGAGVAASALAMDKALARSVFESHGLRVAPWALVTRHEWNGGRDAWRRKLLDAPGLPLFVKPANGGSSVGISRVTDAADLDEAMNEALRLDRRVVVERGLDAREIECAVLGNDVPEVSVPGEIVPGNAFYDYAAKYVDDNSELRIPAPLTEELADRVRGLAARAYTVLDVRGFARVDFLVARDDDAVYVNEVNTLPGFTPISMFPKLWAASGVGYPELIERLVRLSLDDA